MAKANKYHLPADLAMDLSSLAESIADEYCPSGCVEPETIAQEKGITISFGQYGDSFDGMLEHKRKRFHIFVNLERVDRPTSPRARFTLGHELGHYFIDDHRNALASGRVPTHPSLCEFESTNPVEVQADFFASNLLLPSNRFRKKAKKLESHLEGVLQLADIFRTSVTATAIRFVSLGITPSAVIRWSRNKYSWKWISEDWFDGGFRKTIESRQALPDDSATALALSGETAADSAYVEKATLAHFWFPFARGADRNLILLEQAIQLGRFGTLTLLTPTS